jgi:hypothetical protein
MPNESLVEPPAEDRVSALFAEAIALLIRRRVTTSPQSVGVLYDYVRAIGLRVPLSASAVVDYAHHDVRDLIDLAVTALEARGGDRLEAIDLDTAARHLGARRLPLTIMRREAASAHAPPRPSAP